MSGKWYTVQSNDSWAKIAGSTYGNQRWFQELQKANPHIGGVLRSGMKVWLPSFDTARDPLVETTQTRAQQQGVEGAKWQQGNIVWDWQLWRQMGFPTGPEQQGFTQSIYDLGYGPRDWGEATGAPGAPDWTARVAARLAEYLPWYQEQTGGMGQLYGLSRQQSQQGVSVTEMLTGERRERLPGISPETARIMDELEQRAMMGDRDAQERLDAIKGRETAWKAPATPAMQQAQALERQKLIGARAERPVLGASLDYRYVPEQTLPPQITYDAEGKPHYGGVQVIPAHVLGAATYSQLVAKYNRPYETTSVPTGVTQTTQAVLPGGVAQTRKPLGGPRTGAAGAISPDYTGVTPPERLVREGLQGEIGNTVVRSMMAGADVGTALIAAADITGQPITADVVEQLLAMYPDQAETIAGEFQDAGMQFDPQTGSWSLAGPVGGETTLEIEPYRGWYWEPPRSMYSRVGRSSARGTGRGDYAYNYPGMFMHRISITA